MKKLISLLIAALLPSLAFAQFKVSADGNAGTPNYSDEAQFYVSSDDASLVIKMVI